MTVAAVCQSSQGHFIAASAMVVPNITNPETLEAMACLEALALAEDCGVYRLIVASDCLNVINNIKGDASLHLYDDPSRYLSDI